MTDRSSLSIFSPEFLGPLLENENISLEQVLLTNKKYVMFKNVSTFIPDELLFFLKFKDNLFISHFAIVLLLDISDFYLQFNKLCYVHYNGNYGLYKIFNLFTSAIMEEIYISGGDFLKITDYGILTIWREENETVLKSIVKKIVACCFNIKQIVKKIKCPKDYDFFDFSQVNLKMVVCAGIINFTVIGEDVLNFIVTGDVMLSAQKAILFCLPNDIILDKKAWQFCTTTDYLYKSHNDTYFKVIKQLHVKESMKLNDTVDSSTVRKKQKHQSVLLPSTSLHKLVFIKKLKESYPLKNHFHLDTIVDKKYVSFVHKHKLQQSEIHSRFILDKNIIQFSTYLKRFLNKSILEQIENERPLDHITEIRNITVVFISISFMSCTESELIMLVNECHIIISKACKNVGYIQEINLNETNIVFCIVFGTKTYLKNSNHCRYGILCAWKLHYSLKTLTYVDEVSVGVSTGMACCLIVGPSPRRCFVAIGPPTTKAKDLMLNTYSSNMIECDLNTRIYSGLKKIKFQLSSYISGKGFENEFSYIFLNHNKNKNFPTIQSSDVNDIGYKYPLLNRIEELEIFDDILNDIGIKDRTYSGIIIEGSNRIGKSRVLDAFDIFAKEKQITVVKHINQPLSTKKSYVVIYQILKQILKMEDCKTITEFERHIIEKFGHVIQINELCYLNVILRVNFKLSKEYILDSDWIRHCKTIKIFERILKNNRKLCILLDDVQYMDYMSWQFLMKAINNKNIILAMTIHQPRSWKELSRVEIDIYNNEHLLRHTLTGLKPKSQSALICQIFDIQGISHKLNNFFINNNITHPGWIELFIIAMILSRAIKFTRLSPDELIINKFFFPPSIFVTKIPSELTVEEVTTFEPWNTKSSVSVCYTNKNFNIANSMKQMNIRDLALEVYMRLSIHEQNIVKCAAIIGKVFTRQVLENIIPNHQSLKTAVALKNLFRLRIFECATLQRRSSKDTDLLDRSFKPRSTFSDMHHLLRCRCQLNEDMSSAMKNLPRYAHCQLMEFKIRIFQQVVYKCITKKEKIKYYTELVKIYQRYAKKCRACGEGSFFMIPGKVEIIFSNRPSTIVENTNSEISDDNLDQNIDLRNKSFNHISIIPISLESIKSEDFYDAFVISIDKDKKILQIYRKSRVHPASHTHTHQLINFKNFAQIDFRNCRCRKIINIILFQLEEYIVKIDDTEKIIDFMMEYAAALISDGQLRYALKLLIEAEKLNHYVNTYNTLKESVVRDKTIKKSLILCLRGKAYEHLGNYAQAKINYMEALTLFNHNFYSTDSLMCYKTLYQKIRQNVRWKFFYNSNLMCEEAVISRQNTASCLRHVSLILMINKQFKAAKLASVQSIVFGFSCYDSNSFYNQCQLYISVVKIFAPLGELVFLNHVEKYILFAITHKKDWTNIQDIIILTYVYYTICKVRLLQGYLERAVQFGELAFRLTKFFHMTRLMLKLLPLLVQMQMRLKRLCHAIDMLHQLRDVSFEDLDKSALTWYYALCMDLLLDAGITIERYTSCANYAKKIIEVKSGFLVLRDTNSVKRLLAGLRLWQLRKNEKLSMTFFKELKFFLTDIKTNHYSQIITLCKILESYLLLLKHCLNMKKGNKMMEILMDIKYIMKILDRIVKISNFVKPRYYLLKAYFHLVHGHTILLKLYLRKAKKQAEREKNLMELAWIIQNKNTWKAVSYNNMARYWEEYIDYHYTIVWQDVDMFNLDNWSNLLYALPIPNTNV